MKYTPQQHPPLAAGVKYARPTELPRIVHFDDPATDVMTDFSHVNPVTTKAEHTIDDALEQMRSAGVRLLLVVNSAEEVVGLISNRHIRGEKPLEIIQNQRIRHSEITVGMIMRRQPDIAVLELAQVQKIKVGHIIETLRKLERHYILVVDIDPRTGGQIICGLFSLSQIKKQLGVAATVAESEHQSSVAELMHELGA